MNRKKSQQEMVGFVLIVVIVIIGLLVLMIFVLNQQKVPERVMVNNILSSVMRTSTSCALVYEPRYETVRDLFRACYDIKRCTNTNEMACDVLERTIKEMLDEVLVLDSYITAYELDFYHSDLVGEQELIHILKGSCNQGNVYGSEPQQIRITRDENLVVYLKVCVLPD